MIDFYALNRQLSETRTHVELSTSCWQEAAIYVNNNFVVQEYLKSDDMFEVRNNRLIPKSKKKKIALKYLYFLSILIERYLKY